MAAKYPDIVKIIAVGNEAMVTWQGHFVSSEIILKWVDVVLGHGMLAVFQIRH